MALFSKRKLKLATPAAPEKPHTLLLVDDEEANLRGLCGLLEDEYNLLTAKDGSEALEILRNHNNVSEIHLIISDQRMPRMTGVEMLRNSTELAPDAMRIILTGFTDVQAIIEAINTSDVYKFLTKPIEPTVLHTNVQRALEIFALRRHNRDILDELQHANQKLTLALRVAKVGIWEYLDTQLKWDDAAVNLLGDNPPNSFEQLSERVHPNDRDRVQDFLSALTSERDHTELAPFRYLYNENDEIWLSIAVRSTGPQRFVGTLQDLTEQKQQEQQLMESEKLMTLGQIAAGISHELRNPLSVINMEAELLSAGIKEIEPVVDVIHNRIEYCMSIMQNMLDFGRQASAEQRSEVVPKLLIDRSVQMTNYLCRKQGVTVETQLAKDLPAFSGNFTQLQQVLVNLITNAVHALEDREPRRILLKATHSTATPESVVFSVEDNGCGIPPEKFEQIFKAFYTSKPVGKGTGLGLSITKKIVDDHQGQIRVESTQNVGTTFYLDIPIHPPAA